MKTENTQFVMRGTVGPVFKTTLWWTDGGELEEKKRGGIRSGVNQWHWGSHTTGGEKCRSAGRPNRYLKKGDREEARGGMEEGGGGGTQIQRAVE